MDDVSVNLGDIKLEETLFTDVKYYVTGHVQEKILEILRQGGAERMNYFSDYVTHLVCGKETDENDLSDATDVYEIPTVTPRWVITCAKLKKIINPKGFKYDPSHLFNGLVFCFSKVGEDKNVLWSLISYNGGLLQHNLTSDCTHLVTFDIKSPKYLKAVSLGEKIQIVTPDWVVESVKNKILAQTELFHPKLLTWPKPRESTALITGFEQDDNELKSDIPDTESTQALLDKLKQRMPWNQPTTPTTTSPSSASGTFQNFLSPSTEPTKRLPWNQQYPNSNTNTPNTSPYNFNPATEASPIKRPLKQSPNFSTASSQPEMSTKLVYSQSHTENQSAAEQHVVNNQLNQPLNNVVSQQQREQQQREQQQLLQQQRVAQIRASLPGQQFSTTNAQNNLQQVGFNLPNQNQINLPSQLAQPNQVASSRFVAQNQHLVQNQSQAQYKLQGQIGQPQVQQPHLAQQQQQQNQVIQQTNSQQLNLVQQNQQQLLHGQPQLVQNQINQNRLGQQSQLQFNNNQQTAVNQQVQFPMQAQQLNQQTQQQVSFGPRGQVPFSSQNQIQNQNQIYGVQNQTQQQIPGPQNTVTHQFMQQKVQQRPQLHPNWQQQQQLNQQQQINQQQLGQQQINQQQLGQQQLNQQQLNPQLTQQQLNQQQLNPQLAQQQLNTQLAQQQLNQQQLSQQQLQQQQINQQQLNQQQLGQQQLNQQLNTQQLNPQLAAQQQQLNQQQLNQQHLTQQQLQQQQLNQQQLNQQQLNPQLQQQQQLNPQLQQQQLAQQQLGQQPHLVQQQLNQQQLNQQQLNQQQLTQQQLNQQQLNQQQLSQQHLVQQQLNQQQLGVQRHPHGAARLNWSPNQQGAMPQRQLIHLDAQTHQQLQQMDPQQRALFVAKIQKQRQLLMQQRQQQILQQQQRGGHIAVIRGGMPPGLTPQQQMQWLQQQAAKPQTIVMQPGAVGAQHAPGLSPIAQGGPVLNEQQMMQRQHIQRIQQLQMQREQAQKQQLQQGPGTPMVRPPLTPTETATVVPTTPPVTPGEAPTTAIVPGATPQQQLVVNAKTKTALANMLSIRLQSGGTNIPTVEGEPSAAGTLRLMTAQHNAALNQAPTRPQDLLAMQQQRRTLSNITNATADIPRAPPTPAPAGAPPTEPIKQQFSPGRVLAPPQHRHGPFYGHNPNLKLPPDLFLLGCIFVVVEVEQYLCDTCPSWRLVLERHGGEVEPLYTQRVTHVLCETQRHGVVMQAIRDAKRCVTLFWLDDVVRRKQVLPPWQALHLPTGYMDGAPASKHLISLSGFIGNDRNRVRDMIKYTGAKYTSYFSRHNTLLVCAKPEGIKYQHSKKWGTAVVNVQWLTDLMLGNFSALNQIEHAKYQQFSQPVHFGFDTALVPTLMYAWRHAINISQESYERIKRGASPAILPPKAKKPKLEIPQISENDVTPMEVCSTYRILFSGFPDKEKIELSNMAIKMGAVLANDIDDATHLVMPRLTRTIKLIFAIIASIQIVPDTWLKESVAENKFLDESNYKFDTTKFNSNFSCDFYKTLETKDRDKLFQNKVFYMTPSVGPSYKILKKLIEKSGGVVEKIRRSVSQIEAANNAVPYSYIILANEKDLHLIYDCLRNCKDKLNYVSTSEVVMMAILNQSFSIDQFLVKVY